MFSKFRKEVEKTLLDKDIDPTPLKQGRIGDLSIFVNKEVSIEPKGLIGAVTNDGPYLNFFINWNKFGPKVLTNIDEKYGSSKKKGKIVFDTTHPNVGKPMHVGHLRSAIIGNSLIKIHKFLGYDVISDNYLGDWGTQYGKLAHAYERWGSEKKLNDKGVEHLLELYIKFHEAEKKDPELTEKAREYFSKMENGDKVLLDMWKRFVSISRKEMDEICERLGIEFDSVLGESFYSKMIDGVYKDASKVSKEDDGALIIPMNDVANLIIKKSNGASTYATRDLARIKYLKNKYRPIKNVYVVDSGQSHHFKQIFTASDMMKYKIDNIHVPFGFMKLSEGKLSTRTGNIVLLKDLLDEGVKRAKKLLKEKKSVLNDEDTKKIAIGAIKFSDLVQSRNKDVTFSWSKSLSFEGRSSPYIQYTYVRAKSIIRKSDKSPNIIEIGEEEIPILKELSLFPDIVQKSASEMMPHHIAEYVYSLSNMFNSYYEKNKIIGSDNEATKLAMVSAVSEVISRSLELLGIDVLEEM